MKLLLLKDIKGVGRRGDLVEASDGYSRNFLIPRGFAKLADTQTTQALERERKQLEQKQEKLKKISRDLAHRLTGANIEFSLPADEKGHLYAGLKEAEILAKIRSREPALRIEAKLVDYTPIKQIGGSKVKIKLSPGDVSDINVIVKKQNS